MNRDPTVIGRAKVGAELIAEVVNGFVEPITWKTLASTGFSLSAYDSYIWDLVPFPGFHANVAIVPDHFYQHFAFPVSITASSSANCFHDTSSTVFPRSPTDTISPTLLAGTNMGSVVEGNERRRPADTQPQKTARKRRSRQNRGEGSSESVVVTGMWPGRYSLMYVSCLAIDVILPFISVTACVRFHKLQ